MKRLYMKYIRLKYKFSVNIILLFICATGLGKSTSDTVIFSAMKDELKRNFEELSDTNYNPPFFIAYTLADVENTLINATLGAIYGSESRKYKDWQVRVLVGDYEINDENFNYDQPQENIFRPSLEMPIDNDYLGIRRSLWLTTNNVYLVAAQTYKAKMELISHKELKESDLQIPDFSRAPVVKIMVPSPNVEINRKQIEKFTKEVSALFKQFPEIYFSDVTCNILQSMVYYVNSEGTEVQFPYNLSSLTIQAGTMSDDSERIHRKIAYTLSSPDEFPDLQNVSEDILTMVDNLMLLRKAERFTESYAGPVLALGDVVAGTFENVLFSGSDQLIANRESLQSSSQMNLYYDKSNNGLESRIDKMILAKDLTIIAESGLENYNDIPLLGNFQVDVEGVLPPEKLVLIENGVLKTLLNGRTPSRNITESNGHMRYDYNYGRLIKQVGPGVIKVTSSDPVPLEELKKRLIEQAKEEGLEYGIIVKTLEVGSSIKPINIYRISIETGEEELIRSVRVKPPSLNTLKRHQGVSGNLVVHNTLLAGSSGNSVPFPTGMPVSFIVPDAILLEDIEVESIRQPLTSMLPVIENPVGIIKTDAINE